VLAPVRRTWFNSLAERNVLRALPGADRKRHFLRLRKLKEAIAKASGDGVHRSLAEIAVYDVPSHCVSSLRLTRNHVAAVAFFEACDRDRRVAIRLEEFVPGGARRWPRALLRR
jgi:phosphopantetheinyl transferase